MTRIYQLDAMRFFALVVIILSHFEFLEKTSLGLVYSYFFHNATLGVDFFFLLSGFGLFYSGINKDIPCDFYASIKYAMSKMKKIYPIYVISLLISIPNIIFFRNGDASIVFFKFFLNLTLLQSGFGMTKLSHGINDVCWFLSTLFLCYIFAPIMISFVKKNCKKVWQSFLLLIVTYFLIIFFSIFFSILQIRFPLFDDIVYGSIYVRGFYFFLGMVLAKIMFQIKFLKYASLIEIVVLLMSFFWFLFRNIFWKMTENSLIILRSIDIFVVVSCFAYAYGQGFLSKKLSKNFFLVKWGGGYGMYLFLLHYPIRMTVEGVYCNFSLGYDLDVRIIEVFLIIILTIIFSVFFRYILENLRLQQKIYFKVIHRNKH